MEGDVLIITSTTQGANPSPFLSLLSKNPLPKTLFRSQVRMEQRIIRPCSSSSRSLHSMLPLMSKYSCLLVLLVFLQASTQGAQAYTNYTVGGSLGWFDNLMEPKVNYQSWAAGKNFSLGDFLFFNTDKNHSVIQTYNKTTYKRCDYNDADNDDTIEWSIGEPEYNKVAVTVEVPLLKEGTTYFFSGNYDGEQCKHGQHFKINVSHGNGLPDSLKSPAEQAPAPAPANPDNNDNVPDTAIPSNFDHPKGTAGDVKATSAAGETLVGRFVLGLLLQFLVMVRG